MDDTSPPGEADFAANQAAGAQIAPDTRLDRILAFVPRALSSHAHVIFLGLLGVYLVLLPLLGVNVSARAELIGGNYTNVTSDLGACIAAGLTVHLARRERTRSQELRDLFAHMHRRHDEMAEQLAVLAAAATAAEQRTGPAQPPEGAGGATSGGAETA